MADNSTQTPLPGRLLRPNSETGLILRMIRRRLRRWKTLLRWRALSFEHAPILFANSFPKSGTHLLTQVMQGFTHLGLAVDSGLPAIVTFDGFSGRQRSQSEILADLRRLLPGDIAYGHVHAFQQAADLLFSPDIRRNPFRNPQIPGFCAYFILRDPRDVVISHVHYVSEMAPNHIHYRYYQQALGDFDERLKASIQGVPISDLEKATGAPIPEPLPDILARFTPYLGWLDYPQMLILRYEDFISDRQQTLGRVFDHAVAHGFDSKQNRREAIALLEKSIDPQRSPTFRSGKIGAWRSVFKEHHTRLFKEVTGDLLERLGYAENDLLDHHPGV